MKEDNQKDIRSATTTKIWGIAVGMLGVCIPLTAITRSGPILPLAVITGATVSTVAVWKSSEKKSGSNILSPHTVEALEERIANLEIIVGNDAINFEQRLKQLDSRDKVREI
jgi:hypothetical protein